MENEVRSEVYNINCIDYMKSLPDNYFDLSICDPPYSHSREGMDIKGKRFRKGRFDRYRHVDETEIDIDKWDVAPPQEFWDELFRVSKNQIVWGGNYFSMPPTRCFLVWKKNIPEQFSMAMCEYAWTSFNGNAKIFECDQKSRVNDKRFHPTQKPIELYAWILKNYAKDGDLVFDPTFGSGSSRIAAYKLGLPYVGCEISPLYFNAANERFNRIINGIQKTKDGGVVQQLSLF